MNLHLLALAFLAASIPQVYAAPKFDAEFELTKFYRGNTHTHSVRSDGDSPPEEVVQWYHDNGYHFLVMTDHNQAAKKGEFEKQETPDFKVIAGEEVSYASHRDDKQVSVHVNSLCSTKTANGKIIDPVANALQTAIDSILTQPGAVAQINHPNFEWALGFEDILSSQGALLMEVANQHPYVHNAGDATHPSVESLWDRLLSAGKLLYGIADDDMHDLKRDPGFEKRLAGQGWVQVAADELSDSSICAALKGGRFYASTGIELSKISTQGGRLQLSITPRAPTAAYTTDFIGKNGEVLARVTGLEPSYTLRGDETYVRARVSGPEQIQAWVQPTFTKR